MTIKPFIHLLRSPHGYYFYDVNRNEIVSTNPEIFATLEKVLHSDEETVQQSLAQPSVAAMRGFSIALCQRTEHIS